MTTVPTRKDVKNALRKAQDEPKAVSKAERHRYALVKERAYQLERENNDSIIVFPAADEPWYKMGNFSALVYIFDVGLRMGKFPKIQVDGDKGAVIFDWVAFIRDLDAFEKNMARIGYAEVEDLGDGIKKFSLGRTYTKSEIRKLYAQVQDVLDSIRTMAKVEKVFPKVYAQLIKIFPIYYSKIKKMNIATREMIGNRIWDNLLKINSLYHAIARGKINSQTGLKEIVKYIDAIVDADIVAANISIWSPQTAVKMSKMMIELKELVVKEIKDEIKK